MWKKNNQSISSGSNSLNLLSGRDIYFFNSETDFPTELVDQKILQEVNTLRKSRFFSEFDRISAATAIGRRLVEGQLSRGTDAVRSQALAWCARILSNDALEKAGELLRLAKALGSFPEIEIADSFVSWMKEDKNTALDMLAQIDSPASRSAAFMIMVNHEGGEKALGWLKKAEIEATDLDADGKYFLLQQQLHLGLWDAAMENLDSLDDQDLEDAPILHHLSAMTQLLSTVPIEFRAIVLSQIPFDAASFRLASDTTSMAARRAAQCHFTDAALAARQLNCPRAATVFEDYALWLELKDPESFDNGKCQLEAKLRDTKSALRLVPLGLQFGIKLDLSAVEDEIERQIALRGGITQEASVARFALAFMQKTPEAVANYIDQHYGELSKYLDKKAMKFLQVEMFSRAGLIERANECLDLLLIDGLSEAEEYRLRRIISEAEGADPIETRKTQFKKTDSLSDLVSLVEELEIRENWDELCEYGAVQFKRTRAVIDAERLSKALSNTQKSEQLVEFLKTNPDILSQSRILQMLYAWALYHEGAFIEARAELIKQSDDREMPHYRELEINLGIALGDWNSLLAIVANEFAKRTDRSARDLIKTAHLALHLSSPHAKDLIFAASTKAGDDAALLASAYFLATSAGWESDSEVAPWLHKAAELSGNDGPIQLITLKDILDRKPDWDRQASETWRLLSQGEIPMFLAGQFLNKSLVDLTLFPAFANLSESDPRRRSIIPAFSGKRLPAAFDPPAMTVALDATALLTLSFLNLLDKTLNTLSSVYVSHSTLIWLFEEKQKASFHQPSRIKYAHQVRDLLARAVLEKLIPSSVVPSELPMQVGDELALLISEAEKIRDNDNTQRIVVRSSPVYRLSSLMQEEADLSSHATVLSSCLSIVEKLREKGQITAAEYNRARAYLQLHEKSWPNQPEISDGAVLYLDDLTITYFLHLGILDKLHDAGFRIIISPREVLEANALIAYEGISDKVNEAIERIRYTISSRIESGKIRVGRHRNADDLEIQPISEHPSVDIISLAPICDAVISDDRSLNQHIQVDDTPILSTLDLLDALVLTGAISAADLLEHRTLLRRAGYSFMQVTDDELLQHLNASVVKDNQIIETAELKAIRENILQVRMSDWLQLPQEAPWLDAAFEVFIRVIKRLWMDGADFHEVTARSNWLVDQIDIRGWAHSLAAENRDNIIKIGRGAHIMLFLFPPSDASQEIINVYWTWAENKILAPVKEQFPELYAWIVNWYRTMVIEMVEMELTEAETI